MKTIRQLAAIAEQFKLDSLEVEGIKVTRSQHLFGDADYKRMGIKVDADTPAKNTGPATSLEELDEQLGIGKGAH